MISLIDRNDSRVEPCWWNEGPQARLLVRLVQKGNF